MQSDGGVHKTGYCARDGCLANTPRTLLLQPVYILMQQHDIPHGLPVRLTPRPGSPETGVSAVELSEHSPRGVIKVLERAFAPDLVPKSVMIGDKRVDTVQYIAEIADIARHRCVGILPDVTQSVDEGLPLAADAADGQRPTAVDQASSEAGQPDAQV